jgi:hypothetical protein
VYFLTHNYSFSACLAEALAEAGPEDEKPKANTVTRPIAKAFRMGRII